MLIYGIIKNHQKRPSPTGHPKKTSPKGNVFFCEKSSHFQDNPCKLLTGICFSGIHKVELILSCFFSKLIPLTPQGIRPL